MRIFVTGSTGFIGSHFLEQALAAGHEVVALRRRGSTPKIPLSVQPIWIEGELSDDWSNELNACTVFVHLAAAGVVPARGDTSSCFEVNVINSVEIWKSAIKSGIRKFVICGSCFEYGKAGEQFEFIPADAPLVPTGLYHASKAAASMMACALAVEHRLTLEIVRPFQVFGPGEHHDRFWPALRKAALAGEDFKMTEGLQIRDFIDVTKAASEIISSATNTDETPRITIRNIASGAPQLLIEFAEKWWKKFGASGKLIPGGIPSRDNEIMRYVACLKPVTYQDSLKIPNQNIQSEKLMMNTQR